MNKRQRKKHDKKGGWHRWKDANARPNAMLALPFFIDDLLAEYGDEPPCSKDELLNMVVRVANQGGLR
jgi:hypothetical protein